MAKGFARLGIIFFSFFTANGVGAATVADLLISEIMVNPAAVSDTRGEWFELYNPGAVEINLRDITIGDDGGDRHRIETDLLILPGHFLTLGRNGDTNLNGGFVADYVYDDFTLSNSGDEIVLRNDLIELLRLEYGAAFDSAGRSRELVGLPMRAANYALTLAGLDYGLGDIGTPGGPGSVSFAPSAVPLPPDVPAAVAVESPAAAPKKEEKLLHIPCPATTNNGPAPKRISSKGIYAFNPEGPSHGSALPVPLPDRPRRGDDAAGFSGLRRRRLGRVDRRGRGFAGPERSIAA